jgi:hypothetical protein
LPLKKGARCGESYSFFPQKPIGRTNCISSSSFRYITIKDEKSGNFWKKGEFIYLGRNRMLVIRMIPGGTGSTVP